MRYLVSYDIRSSYERKILIDFLFSLGFIRIQKSVFLGNADEKIYSEIRKVSSKLDHEENSVLLCPLCENDFYKAKFVGVTADMFSIDSFSDFLFF